MKSNGNGQTSTELWFLETTDGYLDRLSKGQLRELTKDLARVVLRLDRARGTGILVNVLGNRPLSEMFESREGLPWSEFDDWVLLKFRITRQQNAMKKQYLPGPSALPLRNRIAKTDRLRA